MLLAGNVRVTLPWDYENMNHKNQKHPKDNLVPKYNLQKETYVVWLEHDEDESQPGSGGLTTLTHFENNYKTDKLYRDNHRCWIEVLYTFEAASPEEASFIHNLREYGTAYNPIGDSEVCHSCERFSVFPKSSCKCPLCGTIDEDKQEEFSELMAKRRLEKEKDE